MPTHTVHDVRIAAEVRQLPPEDGWACWEPTGYARLECSCGHTDRMVRQLAPLMALLHIQVPPPLPTELTASPEDDLPCPS